MNEITKEEKGVNVLVECENFGSMLKIEFVNVFGSKERLVVFIRSCENCGD